MNRRFPGREVGEGAWAAFQAVGTARARAGGLLRGTSKNSVWAGLGVSGMKGRVARSTVRGLLSGQGTWDC